MESRGKGNAEESQARPDLAVVQAYLVRRKFHAEADLAERARQQPEDRLALELALHRIKDKLSISPSTAEMEAMIGFLFGSTSDVTSRGLTLGKSGQQALVIGLNGMADRKVGQQMLSSLLGKARRAVVTVACPGHPGEFISARVERGTVRIRARWDGQRPSFEVRLKGQTNLSDVQCPIDLRDPGTLGAVQALIEARVRERVEDVIRHSQAAGADPFEFGLTVRAWQSAAWQQVGGERWPQSWAKAQVQVIPDIRIVHVRLLTRRPGNGGGEERRR